MQRQRRSCAVRWECRFVIWCSRQRAPMFGGRALLVPYKLPSSVWEPATSDCSSSTLISTHPRSDFTPSSASIERRQHSPVTQHPPRPRPPPACPHGPSPRSDRRPRDSLGTPETTQRPRKDHAQAARPHCLRPRHLRQAHHSSRISHRRALAALPCWTARRSALSSAQRPRPCYRYLTQPRE